MATRDQTEAGRRLAAARKRRLQVCLACDAPFEVIGKGVYCSTTCKQRAWRRRHAAPPPEPCPV